MSEMAKEQVVVIFLLVLLALCSGAEAKQAYVSEGQIVLCGDRVVGQDNPKYVSQTRLAYLIAIGKASGIYDPIDPDLKTWDNTSFPVNTVCFWEHIELIVDGGSYEYDSDYLVILKPTLLFYLLVDINAAVNKRIEVELQYFCYNQPELYILSKWIQAYSVFWFGEVSKEHWADTYGINYIDQVDLKAAQWSPCLGQDCHYDFTDWRFWLRDMDCSSSTWWYLWWGYYVKSDPNYGNWLIQHKDWVNGSDCLAPGQVADYLIKHGFAFVWRII